MKRYPAYKDSEVDWIGSLPESWSLKRLKYLFKFLSGGTPPTEQPIYWNGGIPWVSPKDMGNGLISDSIDHITYKAVADGKTTLVPEESVLLVVRSGILRHKIPVAVNIRPVTINQDLKGIVPKEGKMASRYFLHVVYGKQNELLVKWKKQGATVESLELEDILNTEFPTPIRAEQDYIIQYLDHKTYLIDIIIEKKQKQIDLLQEQRAAIINQAVTKGLNPKVKMKNSGIEWLGEVPKHWNVLKLKLLTTKIGSGITPKGGAEVYQENGIPLLRSQNIHFDGLRLDDVAYISEEIHDSMSGTKVKPNDVLINITGASIGRCYFVPEYLKEANVNQHVCILRPSEKILTRYLYYYLSSNLGQDQVFTSQVGTSREGLNFEQLKNFFVIVPPEIEQSEIVEHLDHQNIVIFDYIQALKLQIKKIIEYRTTLISEVVTGKIDVRDEAIP